VISIGTARANEHGEQPAERLRCSRPQD